ncbi:hypothetical protein QR685DRAFT_185752 [Neurospora intermedia]|uniref:Uncharacterized protein n=1 Tax=Neurospora intermedia TaxID=5142 RepID=A0ABR3DMA0_NEUIN
MMPMCVLTLVWSVIYCFLFLHFIPGTSCSITSIGGLDFFSGKQGKTTKAAAVVAGLQPLLPHVTFPLLDKTFTHFYPLSLFVTFSFLFLVSAGCLPISPFGFCRILMASWSLLHIIYHQSANSYTIMLLSLFIFCYLLYFFTSLRLSRGPLVGLFICWSVGIFPRGRLKKTKTPPNFYQE